MALAAVTLDDKYMADSGRVYLTGVQALVRLPMMQRARDAAAGLDTACLITGYRGSPLGGYDQALSRAQRFLARNHIRFQPGINEDLAATALWGTQQLGLAPGAKYDGVFGIWYGKGPGVDRCGDVFKHANAAGTAPHGGVLALAGDDHAAKSSTLAHQSEQEFLSAQIPVLHPAGIQDILDFGLYGFAMSRYTGCWVALKTTAETAESSASVEIDPERVQVALPGDFELPPGGLNIRWPDHWNDQEYRLHRYKIRAVLAFARANAFDRVVMDSKTARFGIITTGKSYLDVRQALDDLGIDATVAERIGLRLYKVGLSWPLEPEGARRFAEGLEEVLVVEEKRAVIEPQLKEHLYNWPGDRRPRILGKFDEQGEWILPSAGELDPARIARVIAGRLAPFHTSERIRARLAFLEAKERELARPRTGFVRTPYFCSGCPHNSSTRVPEGSRALSGIGCHFMAQWMDRSTATFSHMGGEGAQWVGQAPFSETPHVFQNIGDGTYVHSGSLALRFAVASGVNMTFKVLYNDAVAMTGGQPLDGGLTVAKITQQAAGEGVRRIAVVSDQPEKYGLDPGFAAGTTIHHRDDLDAVQKELREWPGVSVLVYDQTCAAEKRRRRKRGTFPDPDQRVMINEEVCEGCGDCSLASNCLSVVPVETEHGRKRQIDQSACNKDFSCLKGFCPSLVTVKGGRLRRQAASEAPAVHDLPEPKRPALGKQPYGILVTGVGGTGVVTIGAILGMAAHIDGLGCAVLDMTGLAQKGGAVISHVRIAPTPEDIHAVRIPAGEADLLLGGDLVVAAGPDALARIRAGITRAIINSHPAPVGDFTRNPDLVLPAAELTQAVREAVGDDACELIEATGLATALMGDAIATNLFLLGFAYQRGLIPVSAAAIDQAILLNQAAVEMNRQAFAWGRHAAANLTAVLAAARPGVEPLHRRLSRDPAEVVQRRVEALTRYQDRAYANRYEALVRKVEEAEHLRAPGRSGLALAVARYYYKLLAYKDEYEVARLYTDGAFLQQLRTRFEGDYRLEFNLAPPLLSRRDPATGHLQKRTFGPWMMSAFRLLAGFKGLRGTWADPFGYLPERKRERALITAYERTVAELLAGLDHDNHALAVEIASIPEHIRGYGHVKEEHLAKAEARQAELLAAFRAPSPQATAAE